MPTRFLDIQKSIEAIAYVSSKTQDLFHIMKILYYADKIHLQNFGRLITDDFYVAMKDGPVPSGAYELINMVRGKSAFPLPAEPEKAFRVDENKTEYPKIVPLRKPNTDYLSESDIEALNQAIQLYGGMEFDELRDLVHEEEAYKRAPFNNDMRLEDIVRSLDNADQILEYMRS